jgi:hypothetical protein
MVGFDDTDTLAEAVTPHVCARHHERIVGDVDGVDHRLGESLGARNGDAARTGANVQDPPHAAGIDPGAESLLDQLRDRRTRDQHARIHHEGQTGKPRETGQVDGGNALVDAPPDQGFDTCSIFWRNPLRVDTRRGSLRELQCMPDERRGVIPGVVGAMTEEHAGALQAPCTLCDEVAHGRVE